jgi:oxygen-independent coproporphyrinogen-3 oxidase
MLTCEPGTPLHLNLQSGRYHPLHDRKVTELFHLTIEYLEDHGYVHYEISNFARKTTESKPPRISAHNSKYWSCAPYLGIGASAHSFIEPRRYWNYADVNKYIKKIESGHPPVEANETLTTEQLIMETILLGLRTRSGIDIEAFDQKFEVDFLQIFQETITELEDDGMIIKEQNRVKLSLKGMSYLDSVTAMLTSQEIFPH